MLVVRCPQALILSQQVPETYKTVEERTKIQQLKKEFETERSSKANSDYYDSTYIKSVSLIVIMALFEYLNP